MAKFKNTTHITEPDGEVRVFTKTYSTKVKTEEFYATYLNHVQFLYSLNNTEKNIMIYCCNKAQYNTGEVDITPKDRLKMMALFDVKKAALSNNIKSLMSKNLLVGEKGSYVINPNLFWKGTFDKRTDLIDNSTILFSINYSVDLTSEDDSIPG